MLPPNPLVITFDDGDRSNYLLLEPFREAEAPATIFACSGIVGTRRRFWFRHYSRISDLVRLPDEERIRVLHATGFFPEDEVAEREALSLDEVCTLSRAGFDFQSHTVSHPILPFCTSEKAAGEIADSKSQLEKALGREIFALAYPNGDYSDRECELAGESGYVCALTVDPGFNSDATDPFRLRRLPIGDDDDVSILAAKACGVWFLVKALLRRRRYGYHPRPIGGRPSP